MRAVQHFLRIAASLVVLAMVWTVLFGGSAVEQHFLNTAHAEAVAGGHPYHIRQSIIYVSDTELLFLRAFRFGLPPLAFLLTWLTFSGLDRRQREEVPNSRPRKASWQA